MSVLNFLKASYFLMSLCGSLPVSLINSMVLLVKFCHQREEEVFVGKSLQAFLWVFIMDIMHTVTMVDMS